MPIRFPRHPPFCPFYLTSLRKEPSTRIQRVSVAVMLLSGVQKGQFAYFVADVGGAIELLFKWLKPLVDLEILHKTFLDPEFQYHTYHPEYAGFEEAPNT